MPPGIASLPPLPEATTAARTRVALPSALRGRTVSTTAVPRVPLPKPTGQPPEDTAWGAPSVPLEQLRRATPETDALAAPAVTVVTRTSSIPGTVPPGVAIAQPVAAFRSTSSRTS
ncbi:MAG: hypothetical protein IPQ15_16395 [Betaproteobacteria bacterium]|nr:hypothetical protein [Betaproteobacteria bacterium]